MRSNFHIQPVEIIKLQKRCFSIWIIWRLIGNCQTKAFYFIGGVFHEDDECTWNALTVRCFSQGSQWLGIPRGTCYDSLGNAGSVNILVPHPCFYPI